MRILVCGSRTWDDAEHIFATLDGYGQDFHCSKMEEAEFVIIEGGAKGADSLAAEWAGYLPHLSCGCSPDHESYPADWATYGKSAGPIRNQRMLTQGRPDIVLAFIDKPLEESRGTFDMVQRAGKARVPVYVIRRYS